MMEISHKEQNVVTMFCNRASDVGCLCDQITSYTASYSALTPSLLRTVGFTDISYTVLSSADLEVVTLALFILSDVIKQSVPDSNESPSFRVGPRRLRSLSVWLT